MWRWLGTALVVTVLAAPLWMLVAVVDFTELKQNLADLVGWTFLRITIVFAVALAIQAAWSWLKSKSVFANVTHSRVNWTALILGLLVIAADLAFILTFIFALANPVELDGSVVPNGN